MWPTPADMALLKGKPHSEWVQPEPLSVQQIDFYLGRVPEWYIEQKFLKNPGIFFPDRSKNTSIYFVYFCKLHKFNDFFK